LIVQEHNLVSNYTKTFQKKQAAGMTITIRDIARKLNLSAETVSRAQDDRNDSHHPGIFQLVATLVERDLARIALIGIPEELQSQDSQWEGDPQGFAEASLSMFIDPELVVIADLTSTGGYQATKRLLSIPDPPDAIICIKDETAFGERRPL
jgi:DNA-binding LacI/PurR family transcriptional regulator